MTEEKELLFVEGSIQKHKEFVPPEVLFEELINRVQKYHPSDDISVIEKAYHVAKTAHEGQVRKSGEPYIVHPLNVAIILACLEMDKETVIAGILHDVVEDTVMTEEDLIREFGEEVALLVDGVTKLEKFLCHRRIRIKQTVSWKCRRRTCVRCSLPWQRIFVSLLLNWLTVCIICVH